MGWDFDVYSGMVDPYGPNQRALVFPIRVSRNNDHIFSYIGYDYAQFDDVEELDRIIGNLSELLSADSYEMTSEERAKLYEDAKMDVLYKVDGNQIELSEMEQADEIERVFKYFIATREIEIKAGLEDKKKIREAISVFSIIAAMMPVTITYN